MKIFKFLALMIFSVGLFASCDGYANVKMETDGGVSFGFSGVLGDGFKEMIGINGQEINIDVEGITKALEDSGFSKVKVAAQNDNIMISFVDENRDSYLFQSGIVSVKNNDVKVSLTAAKFLQLYNSSGEDIQMLLDLFLSPVLNDEEMSEEEYVDTISVTYGEDAGKEIDESAVHFTVIDKNGKKRTKNIFAKSIFCGKDFSL